MNRMLRTLVIGASLIIGGTGVALAADAWGEAVKGVQLRVALATGSTPPTSPGGLPALDVQIRNQGLTTVSVDFAELGIPAIEIDDVWYGQPSAGSGLDVPFVIAPGSQTTVVRTGHNVFNMVAVDPTPGRPIEFRPGPHRVRVRSEAYTPDGNRLLLISNRIDINVPGLSATKEPAADAQAATAPSQATDYQLKGWNLQVSLDPENSVVQGEPIYVYFTVHNNSAEDLHVMVGGDDWNELDRPEKFKVQVTRGNGSAIPVRELRSGVPLTGNRWYGPQRIPAKGSYRFSLRVADWAELKEPGEYTITASRTLDLQKYSQSAAWMDDPESLSVKASGTFTLAPFNHAALGAVIDARGNSMLQETSGLTAYMAAEAAAVALAQIDDDRAVPYFRRVVLESTDSRLLSIAIRALGRFNSDMALDTLVQVTRSPKDSTRHSAAVSLSKSPHPGAVDALLNLRTDPTQGIRATVLQKLATLQTVESLQMIREMTNDGYESVRVEALRLLRLRTEGMKP